MKALTPITCVLWLVLISPVSAKDWDDQLKDACLNYADQKANEFVQDSSKKAILALYKKIYPNLKNKNDREALRALGDLGLNASRLNSLASDLASGDPKKVESASQELALDVGKKLSTYIKTDPYMREQMQSLLGSAGTISDISKHLGSLAGGDAQPIYEYAGDLVIQAAGAGNVVGFYRTAYGAMKFAKDAYVDAEIEDLYQEYKKGNLDPLRMDLAGTHFALRDKIIAEKEQKLADLGNVNITDELREHLTRVDEEEFKKRMMAGFESRREKEERDKEQGILAKEAKAEAELILKELEDKASRKYGDDWWETRQPNLEKFLEIIRRETDRDPWLDAGNSRDLKMMSSLLSTKMIYGVDSPEYEKALESFNQIRDIRRGVTPSSTPDDMPTQSPAGTLSGTWSGIWGSSYKVNGSFSLTIDSSGNVSGRFAGDDSGSLSGRLNSSGGMQVSTAGGKAGSSQWSGKIVRDEQGRLAGSGNWSSQGSRGTWRGTGK